MDNIDILRSKSIELLLELINGVKSTKDFVLEQIPDILQQLIKYNLLMNAIWVLFASAILFNAYRYIRIGRKELFSLEADAKNMKYVSGAVKLGIGIVLLYPGYHIMEQHLFPLVKLIVAPKIWLIEYGVDLAKQLKG